MRGRLSLLFVLLGTLLPGLHAARAVDAPVIAVIDSGIEASHPEFESGQVVAWKDWVEGRAEPYDDHGHGTAVASRAAGGTLGAAPGARLAVAKVLNADGSTTAASVHQAIRWAADVGADVINVSIWGLLPDPVGGYNAASAVHYAKEKGALVVWIAGNGGSVAGVPTPVPATTLWGASSPEALVVGSQARDGSGPAQHSQWVPEVLAKGEDVLVAWTGGGYMVGTGTSFAAPWISGVAARLLAAGAPRDVNWLKWVVNHAAEDTSAPYVREGYGWFNNGSFETALAVARGERAVPPRDARDADHDRWMLIASAETGREPAGTTRP